MVKAPPAQGRQVTLPPAGRGSVQLVRDLMKPDMGSRRLKADPQALGKLLARCGLAAGYASDFEARLTVKIHVHRHATDLAPVIPMLAVVAQFVRLATVAKIAVPVAQARLPALLLYLARQDLEERRNFDPAKLVQQRAQLLNRKLASPGRHEYDSEFPIRAEEHKFCEDVLDVLRLRRLALWRGPADDREQALSSFSSRYRKLGLRAHPVVKLLVERIEDKLAGHVKKHGKSLASVPRHPRQTDKPFVAM